ncbi:expressed unknown protein [Seminavis robusta]|uniref:Integrator complex subunit 7 n=1 Tax=Seminavis robusta TaxID=568900 RepID=A0A9N8ECY2_9STRA|nr:expressed unknown protein [Seminavis robusta]|eukprot:Sro814_g206340.1 n/a (1138) ;mRNA; f:23589-27151
MTTRKSRNEIGPLILQLKEACRRPLFTEIVLDESKQSKELQAIKEQRQDPDSTAILPPETQSLPQPLSSSSASSKQQPSKDATEKKTWRELLKEASTLLPYMTDEEHGEISHLASILLLGFLLPSSTGNEYFLLQHCLDDNLSKQDIATATNKYILDMKLEERLENTCRHYAAFEFGEFDTLTDATWELAFDSFLHQGLAPFLSGRTAHYQHVDLFHLLAMAIHPQPVAAAELDDDDKSMARRFMNNRHAHSLHVNYGHRLKIIHMLIQNMVLPAHDPNLPMIHCPLFDDALPHLRASLHTFAQGAVSMEEAHLARAAMLTIAIQSNLVTMRKEEWDFLINRMVDDRTRYPGCRKGCPRMLKDIGLTVPCDDIDFCPHAGRGRHLAEFLIRTCQSRRRADNVFLHEAFSSLTDAIEWQTHCWMQPEDEEPSDSEETPCMLASLLFAARAFYNFLLPVEELKNSIEQQDEALLEAVGRRDDIKACAIQLLHHFDPTIASQAAELLSLALAYGKKETTTECAQQIYLTLQVSLDNLCSNKTEWNQQLQSSLRNVVSATSRLSPSFALSFLNLLYKKVKGMGPVSSDADDKDVEMKDASEDKAATKHKDDKSNKELKRKATQRLYLLQLVSTTAIANSVIAAGKTDTLLELLKEESEESLQSEIVAALLACRQARFFVQEKDPARDAALGAVKKMSDRWRLYQVARLALRTGSFAVASRCYGQLLQSPLSERTFLWMSSLANISNCELCLSKHAAKGIPSATISMRAAMSMLLSLKALDGSIDADYSRTISIVSLRLDFLDLLTGLRQLIREMRLTGVGPVKRTRSMMHFQNILRCFDGLANRYRQVYQRYGLFCSQQSRTSFRTLHALCRFVARSIRSVFSDVHPSQKKEDNLRSTGPQGDSALAVVRFMLRVDDQLLQKMTPSTDLVIRAAAMLEVVDGILLCPPPFPLELLSVSRLPLGEIHLSADPEYTGIDGSDGFPDGQRPELGTIECYPGIAFDFYATGTIPASFLASAKLSFSIILLWHRASYVGPLQEDEHIGDEKQEDEAMADEKQEEDAAAAPPKAVPRPWDYTLASTSMLVSGKFSFKVECPPIREEGNYVIDVKLGCRDVRGGEWEVAMKDEFRKMKVQATRSSWHG